MEHSWWTIQNIYCCSSMMCAGTPAAGRAPDLCMKSLKVVTVCKHILKTLHVYFLKDTEMQVWDVKERGCWVLALSPVIPLGVSLLRWKLLTTSTGCQTQVDWGEEELVFLDSWISGVRSSFGFPGCNINNKASSLNLITSWFQDYSRPPFPVF